jgi:hypothetical protein
MEQKDVAYWDEKAIAESTGRVRTTTTMAAAALAVIFLRVVDGRAPVEALARWALWVAVIALGASILARYWHGTFVLKYYLDMRQGRPEKAIDNMVWIERADLWAGRFMVFGVVTFGWRMLRHYS